MNGLYRVDARCALGEPVALDGDTFESLTDALEAVFEDSDPMWSTDDTFLQVHYDAHHGGYHITVPHTTGPVYRYWVTHIPAR